MIVYNLFLLTLSMPEWISSPLLWILCQPAQRTIALLLSLNDYVYLNKRKHGFNFITDDLEDFKFALSLQLAVTVKLTSFIANLNYETLIKF